MGLSTPILPMATSTSLSHQRPRANRFLEDLVLALSFVLPIAIICTLVAVFLFPEGICQSWPRIQHVVGTVGTAITYLVASYQLRRSIKKLLRLWGMRDDERTEWQLKFLARILATGVALLASNLFHDESFGPKCKRMGL